MDHLLRLCYPVTDPAINELNEVADVLEAAMKYQMEEATAMMRKLLLTFLDTKPLQVFAIACRLQLATEAEVAAIEVAIKNALKTPGSLRVNCMVGMLPRQGS